ncbi:hypothetical protein QCD70_15230 [Agreia sp. PsM10]|uniref:hypothetical protein n=1 Tax=Agreia sp. PsM10 TaxID=3030533 RepID=UPI00263AFF3C|nr:hypothetical protein [Agreia sp. PsM10]MDN4641604.1 hypothetical protein [Agreia sp. PsM10]
MMFPSDTVVDYEVMRETAGNLVAALIGALPRGDETLWRDEVAAEIRHIDTRLGSVRVHDTAGVLDRTAEFSVRLKQVMAR